MSAHAGIEEDYLGFFEVFESLMKATYDDEFTNLKKIFFIRLDEIRNPLSTYSHSMLCNDLDALKQTIIPEIKRGDTGLFANEAKRKMERIGQQIAILRKEDRLPSGERVCIIL